MREEEEGSTRPQTYMPSPPRTEDASLFARPWTRFAAIENPRSLFPLRLQGLRCSFHPLSRYLVTRLCDWAETFV